MKTQAIIPTAGLGVRMDSKHPKPLLAIKGKPMIIRTLEAFEQSALVDSVILVANERTIDEFSDIIQAAGLKKICQIVIGGVERSDSVSNALKVLDQDTELVLVHDGARPLIQVGCIERVIKECELSEAVIVGVKVKSTVKIGEGNPPCVKSTLDRSNLWEIQTPQIFKKEILVKAHEQRRGSAPSDDAMLVEQMGIKVKIIEGDYKNIKVTTKEDLVVAEAFLAT